MAKKEIPILTGKSGKPLKEKKIVKDPKNGRFTKGNIGNPYGRPARPDFYTLFRQVLERGLKDKSGKTITELDLVQQYITKSSVKASDLANLMDRNYGKPTQTVEGNVGFSIARLEQIIDEIEEGN